MKTAYQGFIAFKKQLVSIEKKTGALLYYAVRLINLSLIFLLAMFPFLIYSWYHNYNLDAKYYKSHNSMQRVEFEDACFWQKRNPQNEWLIRVYNVKEVSFELPGEKARMLAPLTGSHLQAFFMPAYRTVEVVVTRDVVNSLFNKILFTRLAGIVLLFLFLFFLRKVLVTARSGKPFSRSAINSFRWMALILLIYCFISKTDADVIMKYVSANFIYGHTHSLFNSRGINADVLLIIGSLVLLCLAESFKTALRLKEEQEFTI